MIYYLNFGGVRISVSTLTSGGCAMRLTANRNASGTTYYIIRSIVREGKRSSEVVERLGNEKEIMEKYHCNDAAAWAKARLEQLNAQEKEKVHKVLMPYRTDSLIPVDRQNSFQVGYLFLQKLYRATLYR